MPIGQYVIATVDFQINPESAARFAQNMGGTLAVINTAKEHDRFITLLKSDAQLWHADGTGGARVGPWIGLYQLVGQGEPGNAWRWWTLEDYTFQGWVTAEPDNSNGGRNAIYYDTGSSIGWADYSGDPGASGITRVKSYAVEFSASKKAISGTAEHDYISCSGVDNTVRGLGGGDFINAGSGKDTVYGDGGNDRISASNGNDRVYGGSGNDFIVGGAGRDVMSGGTGADDFDFNVISHIGNSAATRDEIRDFVHLSDDINLRTLDASTLADGNQDFTFIKTAAFDSTPGTVRYARVNAAGAVNDVTIIYGDINGDRKADFQIELTGLITLTAADFIL